MRVRVFELLERLFFRVPSVFSVANYLRLDGMSAIDSSIRRRFAKMGHCGLLTAVRLSLSLFEMISVHV